MATTNFVCFDVIGLGLLPTRRFAQTWTPYAADQKSHLTGPCNYPIYE